MYEKLINAYTEIQSNYVEREDTIFDICGFPHYETVASNVLAFFINNKKEHALGTLFLDSLISLIGKDNIVFDNDYSVEREIATNKRKFIDIMIYDNQTAIVIENKIYADLNNDLEDYLAYAKVGRKRSFGIVLSLNKIDEHRNGYSFITYEELFQEIKKQFGVYINNKKLNYFSLMMDFIRNIEELKEGSAMDEKFIDFIKEHKDDVDRMGEDIKTLHDDFRRTVNRANNLVVEKTGDLKVKQWAWRELPGFFDVAVSDITIRYGTIIVLDSTIDIYGWEFTIYVRENGNRKSLNIVEYCINKGLVGSGNEAGRFVLEEKFPINENIEVICEEITKIIKALNE